MPGTRSLPGYHDQATRCRLCYVGGAYQALGLVVAARSVETEGSRASRKTGLTCDIVWRSASFMNAGSRMTVWPSARKGVRLGMSAMLARPGTCSYVGQAPSRPRVRCRRQWEWREVNQCRGDGVHPVIMTKLLFAD